jgi:YHS domain-containing protein
MRNLFVGLAVAVLLIGGVWIWYQRSLTSHPHMSEYHHGAVEVVECPVMGTKFPVSRAYGKNEHKGKTYYFCCANCPEAFEKNPEKYVK